MLAANRDAGSVIFASALTELARRYPDRFEVRHNLDIRDGFVSDRGVRDFVAGDLDADCYLCGPRRPSWN